MNERKPPAFEYVLLHGTRDLRPRYRDAVREFVSNAIRSRSP